MVGLPLDLIVAVHRAPGRDSVHTLVAALRQAVDDEAVEVWGEGAEAELDRSLAAVDRALRDHAPPDELARDLAAVVDVLDGPDVSIGPGALDRLSAAVGARSDRRTAPDVDGDAAGEAGADPRGPT